MNSIFFTSIASIAICISFSCGAMQNATEDDTFSVASFPISVFSSKSSISIFDHDDDIIQSISKKHKAKTTIPHPKQTKVQKFRTEEEKVKKVNKQKEYSRNYYVKHKLQYKNYYGTHREKHNKKHNFEKTNESNESTLLYQLVKQTPEYADLLQHRKSHKAQCKEKLQLIYENDQQNTSQDKEYYKSYYQRDKPFLAALHSTNAYKEYYRMLNKNK